MTQSFDAVILDGNCSVVNFPQGFPTVLNVPSTVINTPSRAGAIVITDVVNSVPFTGTYTIPFGLLPAGQRTEYGLIKAKEGTIGDLINGATTINNVLLKSVSVPSPIGGQGALSATLVFELTEVQ